MRKKSLLHKHYSLILSPGNLPVMMFLLQNQFQEHVDPSINLQIYVFYGPERVRDVNYLKRYDIIITTYGTLTCDFRGIKTKGVSMRFSKL